MSLLYNIIIHLYLFAIRCSSLFNKKAASWIRGRENLFARLKSVNPLQKPLIWVHCASLGEFEQGRPVIEALRNDYQDHFILLSFFSPSGYEIRKDYDQVDQVTYLPIDTKKNARRFLDIIKPDLALFVKYEFWFNYIREMSARTIPMVVISANFRKDQHFFQWYGGWSRRKLKLVDAIFVQREDSKTLLHSIAYDKVFVSGDTRFDRVASIASAVEETEILNQFKGAESLLLAGSTWPKDEELILSVYPDIKERMKLVVVPHEVHTDRIMQLLDRISEPYIRYSETGSAPNHEARILIVDTIGLLSKLYKYADIAYIGGGFGVGIHNILEAAAFGKPVIFGPRYDKFQEAVELKELGGAFSIQERKQFYDLIVSLDEDKTAYQKAASAAAYYVKDNQGATALILRELDKIIRNKA